MLSTDWARWSGRERVNVLRAILLNFNKYQLSIVSFKWQNIDIMVWIGREDQSTVYSCACLCLSLWLCRSSHTFSVNIISICYYYESFKYSNFIWFFDFFVSFFFFIKTHNIRPKWIDFWLVIIILSDLIKMLCVLVCVDVFAIADSVVLKIFIRFATYLIRIGQ